MITRPPSSSLNINSGYSEDWVTPGMPRGGMSMSVNIYIWGTVTPYPAGTPTTHFTLPDLPKICPFSPSFNLHFESVGPESKAWIDGFGILSGRQQRYFSTSTVKNVPT